MANFNKSTKTLLGIILLVVGVGLGFWAYQQSGSVGSQINELVTGSPTDRVMLFYIGGAASFIAGLYLLLKK